MKIIFLDIDGVLVHSKTVGNAKLKPLPKTDLERDSRVFDPNCINILNKITEATGASLVISSSWRIASSVQYIKELFEKIGITGEVVDFTPVIHNGRGNEIQEWLDNHPKITEYLIVDDEDEDMERLKEEMLRPLPRFFEGGLQDYHIDLSIEALGEE